MCIPFGKNVVPRCYLIENYKPSPIFVLLIITGIKPDRNGSQSIHRHTTLTNQKIKFTLKNFSRLRRRNVTDFSSKNKSLTPKVDLTRIRKALKYSLTVYFSLKTSHLST